MDSSRSGSVEGRIVEVGTELARTFTGILDAIPGGPHRPKWLAAMLGVNAALTCRLLKAAQQTDPIAVTHMIPGPEPLRRLLKAAEKKKVDQSLLRDAHLAVDRFERLIDVESGDRSSLDAMISGWLPDAREKVELIAKQSVFRGMSQLLGTTSDVSHYTFILFPSQGNANLADQLIIFNIRGLRRVRPGLIVNYDTIHTSAKPLTITGEPANDIHGLLLEQYCSQPLPKLEVTRHGDIAQYTLASQDVGVRSAVDLVHATYLPDTKSIRRLAGAPARRAVMALGIDTPTKTLLFDVLLHEDVFPGQTPALSIHRTAGVFATTPSERSDLDRLDVLESFQSLGQGISKFRSADTPAHQEMIRFVCEKRGWDPALLRGYRCRIDYPIYSSEIGFSFDVPQT